MAATGYTPISTYYTTTASAVPTSGNLVNGELALNINTADGKLFYKDSAGVVQTLATKDSAAGSFVNLAYTGTLTGGTGVVNLGSGQFYKDASGNVGIGTSSPSNPLTVSFNANTQKWAQFLNINAGSSSSGGFLFGNDGNAAQAFMFVGSSTYASYGGAGSLNLGTFGASPATFFTGNTERMRIDSSGNLLVGTTTIAGKTTTYQSATNLNVYGAISTASYTGAQFYSNSYTASGFGWFHFYGVSSNNSVQNIIIYGNGNILNANNAYGGISDAKLKENIVDASPKLDKLMQIKVRNYNLIGEYEKYKQIGVVAQELEQVFPSLVEDTPDRDADGTALGTTTKSVKYSVFVPILIKAIQEQQALITDLTTRLAALETK